MAQYKIEWVSDAPKEWGDGANKTYYYDVAGEFEGVKKSTSIGVKDVSRAPKVGDLIEGHFETVNGREKFKKDLPQAGGFKGGGTFPPKDNASIERQTSLIQAVNYANGVMSATGKSVTPASILKTAQQFDDFLKHKAEDQPIASAPVAEAPEVQQHPDEAEPDLSDLPF